MELCPIAEEFLERKELLEERKRNISGAKVPKRLTVPTLYLASVAEVATKKKIRTH